MLVYDLETSPSVIYSWGLGKQYHNLGELIQEPRIICFAAKWLDSKKVEFYSEWGDGRADMLGQAHRLFDEADAVVGFNNLSFDDTWVRGELIREGFAPPSPFRSLDLYRESRQFRFVSHKLMHLTSILTPDRKMETGGFGLWKQALAGDPKAQRKMAAYNKQDVRVTQELYEVMLPWLKRPLNLSLYGASDDACPRCGSENLERRGFAYTALGKFQQYRCNDCGGWSRGKKNLQSIDVRGAA